MQAVATIRYVPKSVALDPDLIEELVERARERDTSVSRIVRLAARRFLRETARGAQEEDDGEEDW